MNKTPRSLPSLVLTFVVALVVVLGLGGCATHSRVYATEAETLEARGEPTTRWDHGDGTATLEYATQPEGTTCLMVRVDATGKVLQQWDALAAKNLARVKPGMSKEDVAKLLGARRSEYVDSATQKEVWDWNIRHRGVGVATLFNVYFVDGRVEYTKRTRIVPEGEDARTRWYPYPYPYPYAYPYPYPYPYYYAYPYGAFLHFGPVYRRDGGRYGHGHRPGGGHGHRPGGGHRRR